MLIIFALLKRDMFARANVKNEQPQEQSALTRSQASLQPRFLLVLYSYASRRLAPPGTGVPLLRFTQRSQEQSALTRSQASLQPRFA